MQDLGTAVYHDSEHIEHCDTGQVWESNAAQQQMKVSTADESQQQQQGCYSVLPSNLLVPAVRV